MPTSSIAEDFDVVEDFGSGLGLLDAYLAQPADSRYAAQTRRSSGRAKSGVPLNSSIVGRHFEPSVVGEPLEG